MIDYTVELLQNPDPNNPSPETISDYIPDAARIMKLNSATEAELRAMIVSAYGVDPV